MATAAPEIPSAESPAAPASAEQSQADMVADVFGVSFESEELSAPIMLAPPVGTEGEGVVAPAVVPAAAPSLAPTEVPGGPGSANPAQAPAAPAAVPPLPAQVPPVAEPAPVDPALRIAALEAQLAEARTVPAVPAASEAQPAGPPEFNINAPEVLPVQLPANVLAQILGEDADPQQVAAINGVLSAIASTTLHRARAEFHYHLKQVNDRFGVTDDSAAQAEAARIATERRDGYYAKFPHHNSPLIQSILRDETAKLVAEVPGVPWNDMFVASLGARVDGVLTAMGVSLPGPGAATATQGQEAPPTPAASPAPRPRPAAMMPTGARPAPEPEDIVRDTFSWD